MRKLKASRLNWPLLGLMAGLLVAAAAYAFWDHPVQGLGPSLKGRLAHYHVHDEAAARWTRVFFRGVEAFVYAWFAAVGASIGSFFNVVVYRTPRGMHANQGGSRCPYCRTPILAKDNIPIVGWLRLRGRCRACRLPIARRYPIVESMVSLWFVAVAFFELGSGGNNVPHHTMPHSYFLLETLFRLDPIVPLAAFHMLLGGLLLVAALIDWDGFPVPRSVTLWGMLIASILAFLPVYGIYKKEFAANVGVIWNGAALSDHLAIHLLLSQRAANYLVGFIAGGFVGKLLDVVFETRSCMAMAMVFGAALGWQAALIVAAAVCAVSFMGHTLLLAAEMPFRALTPFAFVAASCGYLLAWKSIVKLTSFLPGHGA